MTLGTLLSLAACGPPVPTAVGSYKVTFVYKPTPGTPPFVIGNADTVGSLVLTADGHFVINSLSHRGGMFKGSWSQSTDQVTLSRKKGTTTLVLIAMLKGKNLRDGHIEYLGTPAPVGYTEPWYAVRI
jgi:hypothetical protein